MTIFIWRNSRGQQSQPEMKGVTGFYRLAESTQDNAPVWSIWSSENEFRIVSPSGNVFWTDHTKISTQYAHEQILRNLTQYWAIQMFDATADSLGVINVTDEATIPPPEPEPEPEPEPPPVTDPWIPPPIPTPTPTPAPGVSTGLILAGIAALALMRK